jgi:hypothetical protein
MKAIRTMAILVVTGLGISTAAIAQDSTTTTTTTTTNQAPARGVFVGVPGVAGVQLGAPPAPGGCTTSNSTTTNDQTGATRSTTATNC